MTRPKNKTLKEVVEYLESIGLEVMGPCVDLETGQMFPSHQNFDSDEVLKYRKLHEHDEFWTATYDS